jgi:P4 family phage/plasmid primase-like protien
MSEEFSPAVVARQVVAKGPLGIHNGWFWEYRDGVWLPGEDKHQIVSDRMARIELDDFRSSHVPSVAAMLSSMRAGGLVKTITSDPVPGIINFKDVLLDTETLKTSPHTPDYLSTLQYAVPWTPDVKTPAFDEWAAQVVPEDALEWFLWIFGYLLVPGNPLQRAVFIKGTGSNGKGTWFRMIDAIVGVRHISRVTLHEMSDDKFAVAGLSGKTLNLVGDMGSGYVKNTDLFKKVTGGDELRGQHKFGHPFDFTPWCVPVFAGNTIPSSGDSTYGWTRRWWHIPFPNTFPVSEGYEDRFRLELPGIASKVVLAYLSSKGVMPDMPASVAALKKEFDEASNVVLRFLTEFCKRGALVGRTKTKDLYSAYLVWLNDDAGAAAKPLSNRKFYASVEAAGVKKSAIRGVWYFENIVRLDYVMPGV